MPAQLAMAEHVGLFALEAHAVMRGDGRALRDEHDGIAARIPIAIVRHELRQLLEIGRVLGDDASIGGAGHRGQQRREARVPPEDLDHEKTLMGAG